eukprot:5344753-Amphidinium_carterae.2
MWTKVTCSIVYTVAAELGVEVDVTCQGDNVFLEPHFGGARTHSAWARVWSGGSRYSRDTSQPLHGLLEKENRCS